MIAINTKQKGVVLNTPTLKDAKEQLEYFKGVHKISPNKDTLINLNRAFLVYNTKKLNGDK